MTTGTIAMLLGTFGVPVALLWAGHRLRRRTARRRAMFWGGLTGYLIAGCAALVASMIPPAIWSAHDTWRGLAGFWSMLVLPPIGAAVGALRTRRRRSASDAL